jgi:predicted ester cyclase
MEAVVNQASEPEGNVEVLLRAFAALGRGDIDACVALMTPGFIINIAEMPNARKGTAAWRSHAEILLSAFPDIQVEAEDIVVQGDKVAVRVRLTGTHRGEFLGNAPTGRHIHYRSHEVYRFEDGRLAEEWICSDMVTLLTQVGAFSPGRMVGMWLAGYRLWLGVALGALVGAAGTWALMSLL